MKQRIVAKTNKDITLLSRYYSGNISPDERKQAEDWINRSDENTSLAKDVYNLLYASETLNIINQMDAVPILKRVNRRIEHKSRRAKVEKWSLRITAISFLPLLAASLFYLMSLSEPQPAVRYMEARAGFGLVSSLELPDGSKVWLNSGSYIKYPTVFDKDQRDVYIGGEAYFSVAKDDRKRFIIHAHDRLSLEVTGTELNIDAYETNDFIKATLVEGSMYLHYTNENGEAKKYLMKPEEQITYLPHTHKATLRNVYVQEDIAWKDGRVIFRNTPFDEAMWILSKRFNVDFVVRKAALHTYSFTGSFLDQNLIRILEHFKLSSGINYSQKQLISDDGEIQKTEIVLY